LTTLRPLSRASLCWYPAEALSPDRFAELQPRLERLAAEPHAEVYQAKRRALYRVEDAVLGAVAIKEIRSQGLARALWFRFGREHPGLREFRVGAAFEARGGPTHEFFAAAVELGQLGIGRVLLFFRWLDDARDLSEQLRRTGPEPETDLLRNVAEGLLAHARLGLVHGRHAPGNLLLVPRSPGFDVLAIDFAYASLGDAFDEAGFVLDVSRLAYQLVELKLCTQAKVREFLGLCAHSALGVADATRLQELLIKHTDRRLARSGSQLYLARGVRTT
jgi:hypothetical protein